ncbi:MAG: futalosine hydrolase [Bacteroidales bacterium]|nr:futalosine hydrolase [Bacteroidales bacterium]
MRLLFCAAEQEELDCALQALRLHESQIAGKAQVDFMLTGIGTTSTCYRLTKKLVEAEAEGNPYALAVNIGIAGSYDLNAFPIGTTALIEKEYFGDLGFRTPSGFQTLFDSYALDANLFPFKDGTLQMTQLPDFFNDIANTYKKAVGVTVQTITAEKAMIEEIKKKYNPQIESMEGAAFFYTCLNEYVKFMELRTVSNAVGEEDPSKWNTPLALESLKEACKEFFRQFIENQHKG